MTKILVFGDSISYGAWDKEGGWVQRLRKFLDEKHLLEPEFYYMTYNLGVSGDTTKELLERFEFETKPRLNEIEDIILMFSIGINDSLFVNKDNKFLISQEIFQQNIEKLITLAKKYSKKIIFLGLNPVDQSKVDPLPWRTEVSYKEENVEKYNEILKSVCNENEIHFIEILEKLKSTNYKELLYDGVHPNSEGHKKIFEIVKDYLIKNNIIKI